MIITTRYALRRKDGVWIEAGDTAEQARGLRAALGGVVYECVMCPGGACWKPIAPSTLTHMVGNHSKYQVAAAAGRK